MSRSWMWLTIGLQEMVMHHCKGLAQLKACLGLAQPGNDISPTRVLNFKKQAELGN